MGIRVQSALNGRKKSVLPPGQSNSIALHIAIKIMFQLLRRSLTENNRTPLQLWISVVQWQEWRVGHKRIAVCLRYVMLFRRKLNYSVY